MAVVQRRVHGKEGLRLLQSSAQLLAQFVEGSTLAWYPNVRALRRHQSIPNQEFTGGARHDQTPPLKWHFKKRQHSLWDECHGHIHIRECAHAIWPAAALRQVDQLSDVPADDLDG